MPQLTPLDFNKLNEETEKSMYSQVFPDDMVPREELDNLRHMMDKVERNANEKMK